MSYDISLHAYITTGGPELTEMEVADIGNYTSNVAAMWREALGHQLCDLDGRRAGDALNVVGMAVEAMEASPSEYEALSPSNGWGSYEGALAYLRRLRDACALHPNAQIHISS